MNASRERTTVTRQRAWNVLTRNVLTLVAAEMDTTKLASNVLVRGICVESKIVSNINPFSLVSIFIYFDFLN